MNFALALCLLYCFRTIVESAVLQVCFLETLLLQLVLVYIYPDKIGLTELRIYHCRFRLAVNMHENRFLLNTTNCVAVELLNLVVKNITS